MLQGDSPEGWLLKVREQFVQSASDSILNQLLDRLLQECVISKEEMEEVKAKPQRAEKARKLIDIVLPKGSRACSSLIERLQQVDRYLFDNLNPDQTQ